VLLPRHTGLHACLQTLEPSLSAIYDFTIFYAGTRPASALDGGISNEEHFNIPAVLWRNQGPKDVHIFITRIAAEDVPKDKDEFEKWLNERWTIKDNILKEMYRRQAAQKDNNEQESFDARKTFAEVTHSNIPSLLTSKGVTELNLEPTPTDKVLCVGLIWIVWSLMFLPSMILWCSWTLASLIWP